MAQKPAAARRTRAPVQPEGGADELPTTNRRTSRPPRRSSSGWFRVRRGSARRFGTPPSTGWSALIAIATFGLMFVLGAIINR